MRAEVINLSEEEVGINLIAENRAEIFILLNIFRNGAIVVNQGGNVTEGRHSVLLAGVKKDVISKRSRT